VIVSFSWTSSALLAGAKVVTRRDWDPVHAEHYRAGQLVDAWDRLPRVKGAKRIGTIRVSRPPYRQSSDQTTPEDFHREGFAWLQRYGTTDDVVRVSEIWAGWHQHPAQLFVLEFDLVSTVCPACSAVVSGPLGRTGGGELRCCQHCALNARGCRCAQGEPKGRVGQWDLDDAEIRELEEALEEALDR